MRILLLSLFIAHTLAADLPRAKMPEIVFAVPGQGQQSLNQYAGSIIAVEFISTACLSCEKAAQSLAAMQKEFGPKNFQAILIAVNPNAEEMVEGFAHNLQLAIPVGWATREQARQFLGYDRSQSFLLPQIAIINKQQKVQLQTAAREMDELRQETVLRRRIQSLLNK